MASHSCSCSMMLLLKIFSLLAFPPLLTLTLAQSTLCRTACGDIPIRYPFGIDDGCGSPYYRRILSCSSFGQLVLRTPSGRYPVRAISYSDPHILVSDPFMWNCNDGDRFRPTRPFSLDTSTHLSISPHNDFLFFNCSEDDLIVRPKPMFCEQFPDRCDASCDSASYLCRHLPECASAMWGRSAMTCCSYYPRAIESIWLMLRYCASYTSVYWRRMNGGEGRGEGYADEVAEYGIRVDFDIPVTTRCLECQDAARGGGGGSCGFDTHTQSFLCLCRKGNVTTSCKGMLVAFGIGP